MTMLASNVGKTITCKAAVAWEPNKPLEITEIQVAPPQAGEVRVKVLSNALCHTDIYTLDGQDPEGLFPCILGHEATAVVESVGEGVTSVRPGDWIVPCYTPQCEKRDCMYCNSDKTNLCPSIRSKQGAGVLLDGTSRFSKDSKPIFHFMGCSTFSEYTVLAEISCAKISPLADEKECCLLGCGIATGWGAVENNANVTAGSSVVVFGIGAVGLAVMQAAKGRGAARIVAVDLQPAKLELAKEFGATDCVLSDENVKDNLLKLESWGFDFTFDCTGNVNVMRCALEIAHRGWGVSCVVGVAAAGKEISTRPFQLVTGRRWIGTAFGGWKSRSEVPRLVQKVMRKEISLKPFVTHEFNGIETVNECIETLRSGNCLRGVVHITNESDVSMFRASASNPSSSHNVQLVDKTKVHGGTLMRFTHRAPSVKKGGAEMTLSIFLPPKIERSDKAPPVLMFLGGLTCTDENGRLKANIYGPAVRYGYAVVFPDTCPRYSTDALKEADDREDAWMAGSGGSYYLNATKAPYAGLYNMEDYLACDVPQFLREYFDVDVDRMGVTGFSMGGHGAISLHLKYPEIFKSCSAFSPIAQLSEGIFGNACHSTLLSGGSEEAKKHEVVTLLRERPTEIKILVDQGSADGFLREHLKYNELKRSYEESTQPMQINLRPGYEHNFFFVSSFISSHIEHHAATIGQPIQDHSA